MSNSFGWQEKCYRGLKSDCYLPPLRPDIAGVKIPASGKSIWARANYNF